MRHVLIFIIVVCSALSLNKIYETNKVYDGDSLYDTPMQFALSIVSTDPRNILVYLYFFHYIFFDFVLLVFNMVIDLILVVVIRVDMAKKKKFHTSSRKSASDKKFLEKRKEVETKTNMMIIINVLIYTFCRLPELAVYLFFYYFRPPDADLSDCSSLIICYLLHNVSEYLYMLAYTFNIFLYYKFNSNFETGFRNFFKLKNKKSKT